MAAAMIEVRDLAKRYGAVEALRGVTFSVPRGQVVGLLGPNGAGKTTAMRIVTGYVAPTSGVALVDGHDVFEDPLAARRRIGYLPEGNPLYLDLRLEEAMRFVGAMQGLHGAERRRAIDESVAAAGLLGMERRVIGTLSKGFRQRVGLAQALLHRPDVLILDEPTSGLDPNQQEEMRTLIRGLGDERTVILSTHVLPEVEAVCDRALIISRGRLVADGSIEEIRAGASAGAAAILHLRGSAERAREAFAGLAYVTAVEAEPLPEDGAVVRVRVGLREEADRAAMEGLAEAALGKGLALSWLARERATLEQVFADLTVPTAAEEPATAPLPGPAAPEGPVEVTAVARDGGNA